MTVKQLKEYLENKPDEWHIVVKSSTEEFCPSGIDHHNPNRTVRLHIGRDPEIIETRSCKFTEECIHFKGVETV